MDNHVTFTHKQVYHKQIKEMLKLYKKRLGKNLFIEVELRAFIFFEYN